MVAETQQYSRSSQSPGALRSQATMSIQTYQAQRLVYGRQREGEQKEIVGMFRFAAMLRPIWIGAIADDPYADWWLVRIERDLNSAREYLSELSADMSDCLHGVPAINVEVAESLSPVEIPLNFSNPYAFHGAYILVDFDTLVRGILTARHVGLMDYPSAEKMLAEGGRVVRAAYERARGYRYFAVTREDVTQGNAKAAKASETLGNVPEPILSAELRATYAPTIRARGRNDEPSIASVDEADQSAADEIVESTADVPAREEC